MIDKVYTFFQKVFDGAVATATVALKNEFNQCPTKIIEIVTTGFSGTIDIQGSVAPGTTKDNVAYGLMGQDGTVTPSNNQLSYTADTSRYRYVVTELYPFMDIVMTRSAGSVSVDVFGYGGVSNFPFDGAAAALAAIQLTTFSQETVIATDVNGVTWKSLLDKSTLTKPVKICGFTVTKAGTWAGSVKLRITNGAETKIYPFTTELVEVTDFTSGVATQLAFPIEVNVASGYKVQFRSSDAGDGAGETLALTSLDVITIG